MEKIIYATFNSPQKANEAHAELLQRGAAGLDAVVITRRTYGDPALDFDEPISDVPEPILLAQEPAIDWQSRGIPFDENIPQRPDPFGDISGSMWLTDNMLYPGNLATCLRELGFAREAARSIEVNVLDGGAMVILRVPSGQVSENVGWQTLERHGGTVVTPRKKNPYLG